MELAAEECQTMGEMIQFPRPDGAQAPAYWARPETEERPAALVVLQEWWGINDQIKQMADRLAAAGYQVLVPDLYRGKLATSAAEAQSLMSSLDWNDAAQQDIQGAIRYLGALGSRVGVMGFCMGGALTVIAAAHLSGLEAAVCFYGIPPQEAADPAQIKIPFQAHFATDDDWCTPELVGQLEEKLKSGQVLHDLYRYEAQHAFMNEQRPEVYNPEAAQVAWDRSLAFLRTQLARG